MHHVEPGLGHQPRQPAGCGHADAIAATEPVHHHTRVGEQRQQLIAPVVDHGHLHRHATARVGDGQVDHDSLDAADVEPLGDEQHRRGLSHGCGSSWVVGGRHAGQA